MARDKVPTVVGRSPVHSAYDFQRVKLAFRRRNLLLALLFRKSQSQKARDNRPVLVTNW